MNSFNKPIFIVGIPRTGSTLWQNIIVMDDTIFRLGEMHYLNPWRKDFRNFHKKYCGKLHSKKDIDAVVDLMLSGLDNIEGLNSIFWKFENIKAINEPQLKNRLVTRINESKRELGDIFRIIIEELTLHNGYQRCCVKFPVYMNYINELMTWYPECKIIHIIRDPRAVAVSKKSDPGGTGLITNKYPKFAALIRALMVAFVVIQYNLSARVHLRYRNVRNYALFKYEDLLYDSEATIKALCKFIDVDYKSDLLNLEKSKHEHQSSSITGKSVKRIDPAAALRWRTVITPIENRLIYYLTRGSMQQLGYHPEKNSNRRP